MCAKSSAVADALNYMAQWLPADSNAIGVLAGVNREFNAVFQEEATEIGDERRYNTLKEYISNDLQDTHGFYLDPTSTDEDQVPMLVFILVDEDEEDIIVHLFRGPGSSVMFSSELLDWKHVQINSAEEWLYPWGSLRFLVDFDAMDVE
jgi:hypothetical protein